MDQNLVTQIWTPSKFKNVAVRIDTSSVPDQALLSFLVVMHVIFLTFGVHTYTPHTIVTR